HELLGQRVVIRAHVASELHQRGVAVPLRQVAEDLIVGAVLLDDVEDVLDRRALAHVHGDGVRAVVAVATVAFGAPGGRLVVAERWLRHLLEVLAAGYVEDRHLARAVHVAAARAAGGRGGDRAEPVPAGDEELPAGVIERDRGRVPAGRNEAGDRIV